MPETRVEAAKKASRWTRVEQFVHYAYAVIQVPPKLPAIDQAVRDAIRMSPRGS